MRFEQGNFVETSSSTAAADVVVLDRAVCYYPDWKDLLEHGAARCHRVFGLTYPAARPEA